MSAGPPVLLVEDATSAEALAEVVAPAGWTRHDGFELPAEPWDLARRRLVCVGLVDSDAAVGAALTALARGAGLVVAVTVEGSARHRFLEDLHKVAAPEPYAAPPPRDGPALRPAHEQLLAALAAGTTVTAAAEQLHVSRRTANRLLAEVRDAFGVDTTAAAVSRWRGRPGGG